jgi:hypothetical protein
MPLDRAWYNTLVNDDGSGLTGSVWDKEDVDALMDAIDAELARVDAGISGTFAPTLVSAGGGTPIYIAQTGLWTRTGKHVTVSGNMAISSKGSLAAGSIGLGALPVPSSTAGQQGALTMSYVGGLAVAISSIGGFLNPGTATITLTFLPAAGAAVSTVLDTSHLGASFNIVFTATYLTT